MEEPRTGLSCVEKSTRSLWCSRLRFPAGRGLGARNSAWNHAAHVYTLFHEYGHLLTRTSSVCLERVGGKISRPTDPAERWCEEFSAAAPLPWSGVSKLLKDRFEWSGGKIESLSVPRAIANAFKVSWRAGTIRLIQRDLATWGLYSAIPPYKEGNAVAARAVTREEIEVRSDVSSTGTRPSACSSARSIGN